MLHPIEEQQIHEGIDTIIRNIKHLDVEDVAYFMVKFDPNLADKLAAAIEVNFFEKNEGKKHE